MEVTDKITQSQQIISQTLEKFGKPAIAWTGGKDSTLLLWLVKQVCEQQNKPLPAVVFINEGDPFAEVLTFVDELSAAWNFPVTQVQNDDVLSQVTSVGDEVVVAQLSQENQAAVAEVGFTEASFPFEPESLVGNHLMKTMPLRTYISANDIDALFVGVRWDEHEARSQDSFFREIEQPPHTRVEPILPFLEAEVWDVINSEEIPVVSLYKQGYRSLGVKSTTSKSSQQPAWEQDLQATKERSGRRQDKEKIMKRLRALGYM